MHLVCSRMSPIPAGVDRLKYMGSKRAMLTNGLGKLLKRKSENAARFVDLFTGAGFVAHHVAERTDLPVVAVDLQEYAAALAAAIIERARPVSARRLQSAWIDRARLRLANSPLRELAEANDEVQRIGVRVKLARKLASSRRGGPLWQAYGGHYFSPLQTLQIQALLGTLPADEPDRTVCLASLLRAASQAAASPGHTAQPFQPTRTAKKYIELAWDIDVITRASFELEKLAPRHARRRGRAIVGDARTIAFELESDDLVFLDPPYSGVQYSRFYHVLEAISLGTVGKVSGVGRYPSLQERPQSGFSNPGTSAVELDIVLGGVAEARANAVLTFPAGRSSNGLSGSSVEAIAKRHFAVRRRLVRGRFSTLGGNNEARSARKQSSELILELKPRG